MRPIVLFASLKHSPSGSISPCELCNLNSTKTLLLYLGRFAWDATDKPFRSVTAMPQEVQTVFVNFDFSNNNVFLFHFLSIPSFFYFFCYFNHLVLVGAIDIMFYCFAQLSYLLPHLLSYFIGNSCYKMINSRTIHKNIMTHIKDHKRD